MTRNEMIVKRLNNGEKPIDLGVFYGLSASSIRSIARIAGIKKHNLTPKRIKVLKYIQSYQKRTGRSPTNIEISKHMGWKSPSNANQVIIILEKLGYIQTKEVISRRIIEILKEI